MRASLLFSTAMVATLATPAQAESWYLVGEGDEDLFFADAASVSRNGNYIQMTVLDSMQYSFDSNGSEIYYLRGPMNLDCGARQYQNLGTAGLTMGQSFAGNVDLDTSWQAVPGGSYAEALFEFGCNGGYRGTPINDPFGYAEEYWYYYYDE